MCSLVSPPVILTIIAIKYFSYANDQRWRQKRGAEQSVGFENTYSLVLREEIIILLLIM